MKVKDYVPNKKTAVKTGIVVIGALAFYQVLVAPTLARTAARAGYSSAAARLGG